MPFISCQTNVTISKEQAQSVKSRLREAIELIPGKTEDLLMVSLVDKCFMTYHGKSDTAIAFIDLRILAGVNDAVNFNPISKEIMTILNEELDIPTDKIYISFVKLPDWGCKSGDNYIL